MVLMLSRQVAKACLKGCVLRASVATGPEIRRFYTQIKMNKTRTEKDSLGTIEVPENCLWGAQTQRSIQNFVISDQERMPTAVIRSLGIIKLAAARVNAKAGKLDTKLAQAIQMASQEVIQGRHYGEFPLVVWQTGSGTQTNMNANEVIANRASQILGDNVKSERSVHPNDHVNQGQSTNDTFPTAMHIAAATEAEKHLFPALAILEKSFEHCTEKFKSIIKIGRTHMQDATPMTLGDEFGAFLETVKAGHQRLRNVYPELLELAQGATAVGTGLNTYEGFAESFAEEVASITNLPFKTAPNKFVALSTISACVDFSAALASLAADLLKIANDIRLLSSGPRSGFNELSLPVNEPGSSIMPGKINPTQCEALSMVCAEVIGNHTAILVSIVIYNLLRSIRLLGDAAKSFATRCVQGIEPNLQTIQKNVDNSLMLVTALTPHIGYDKSAKIALHAHANNLTLKQAALELQLIDEAKFDEILKPENMIHPSKITKN